MSSHRRGVPRSGRRSFLERSLGAALAPAARGLAAAAPGAATIALVVDPADPLAGAPPVQWAIGELRAAVAGSGASLAVGGTAPPAAASRIRIDHRSPDRTPRGNVDGAPESLAFERSGRDDLRVRGADARGLVYALLELADRVRLGADAVRALRAVEPVAQRPANRLRSVTRLVISEPEDRPWLHDRSFWERYLAMLARERFNRFSLGFGLGYDAPRLVTDAYFYFPYPFLVAVPGHGVTARGLPERERERNLETLAWIGAAAARRGLDFQLGLWNHAFQLVDSPNANYPTDGLVPAAHGRYCRDALRALLAACPAIGGITLRAHSESGIPEGSYEFWDLLFEAITSAGRPIEIDLHSKGIEHKLLEVAVRTGLPVRVSAKYWAEHQGLPYHAASIREIERSPSGGPAGKIETERRFTRYSYGDYLREGRRYGLFYRIWPGTQRLLLWGDPELAAAYGRQAGFGGSLGLELCEPLTFKGRKGSGVAGGRDSLRDPTLRPAGGDWESYAYGYRLWGRLLYDPAERPETWRRLLRSELGPAAASGEAALGKASRILPLVTVAHHPSASNNRYWPELYTNMPIVRADRPHPYVDSPEPRRFGTVTALDPALFSGIDEFAAALLEGTPDARYSPAEVAGWLDQAAAGAAEHLAAARRQAGSAPATAFRRLAVDVATQAALGRFFAAKLRAGVAWNLYQRTADPTARAAALQHYRTARAAWVEAAAVTRDVYVADLAFGRDPWLRGHWSDRLAAIDADLADMEAAPVPAVTPGSAAPALAALDRARPAAPRVEARLPAEFRRGEPVAIEMAAPTASGVASVRLHYRHVNQAEPYRKVEMASGGGPWRATIPADYTDAPYGLICFFEIESAARERWLYPGLDVSLTNQPYFVLRQAGASRQPARK